MPPWTWQKHGRIITPGDDAPAWRQKHAGMTSALPLENGGYRLFLTGKDPANHWQIGWIDLDDNLRIVHENPANPVLTAGRPGCFDCNGVCMPTVTRVSERIFYMHYVGWGVRSADGMFTNQCGLAISTDNGDTWQRHSEAPVPLLDGCDPIGIGTVFPLQERKDSWRLWYTSFREWRETPNGWLLRYHIRYAESKDGLIWHKPDDNVAIDFENDQEDCVARPVVLREAGRYRMWFCCRNNGQSYRIGYAESTDGRNWNRLDAGINPSPDGWDSEMIEYAWVIPRTNDYLMLYNGNGFGASGTGSATSPRK